MALISLLYSLEQTLREGQKTANVDIQLMLANLQRCDQLIQQACGSEQDSFYVVSPTPGSLSLLQLFSLYSEFVEF